MNLKVKWSRLLKLVAGILVLALLLLSLIRIVGNIADVEHPPAGIGASKIAQIAKTYYAYTENSAPPRRLEGKSGDTVHAAAYILAKETGLNDASIYFLKGDPLAPKNIPKSVLTGDPGPTAKINPAFMNATLSVEIAANIPLDAPVTTTPVAWTRGLRDDGTLAPDSPFLGKGGYIGFLDGHEESFVDKLSTSPGGETLVKYGTNIPTVNIREALPPGR